MTNILVLLITLLLSAVSFANSLSETTTIKQIIKDFDQAIEKKDKEKFLSLFVKKNVSWIGVTDQKEFFDAKASFQQRQANNERVRRPFKTFSSSPEQFIENIIKHADQPKEVFNNINIQENGEVASVYFNYAFFDGDQKKNWGDESWQLVKTEAGWKINAVIFSIKRKQ